MYVLTFVGAMILWGSDPDAPVKVAAKPGRMVKLEAKTASDKRIEWVYDPSQVDLIASETGKWAVVTAQDKGVFRISWYTALDGQPTRPGVFIITVLPDAPPLPTPPGPTPNPPAPTPPPPNPPPPAPSELTQKLQFAFAADKAAANVRELQRVSLVGLYAAMADHCQDKSITNLGSLLADLKKAAGTMIAPGGLVEVRKIIAAEVAANLGTDVAAVLDDTLRSRAVECFTRIARSLKEVK